MGRLIASVLQATAALALLFNLVVGGLPAGALVRVTAGGAVAVESRACCETAHPLVPAELSTVHCCCYTGVVIAHPDQLAPAPPLVGLPTAPATPMWWAAHRPLLDTGIVARVERGHPPPPLGPLRPLTIVIRC
jgi:hypothetical protein